MGVFLLLCTLGRLSWSIWAEALVYWPILLVGLGIRLVFQNSRMPWAMLLSPLLILGTLTYVANEGSLREPTEWVSLEAERPAGAEQWVFDGEMALGRFDLETAELPANLLMKGKATPRYDSRVRMRGRSRRARVSMQQGRRTLSFMAIPRRDQRWDLTLARGLPLDLDLELAFTRGEADLSEAPVSRIDMEGAFNRLVFYLGEPESDVRLDFEGAFNQIDLVVPSTVPVRVSTDGFLNRVNGRRGAGRLKGPGYRLTLEGAFSGITIRSP